MPVVSVNYIKSRGGYILVDNEARKTVDKNQLLWTV